GAREPGTYRECQRRKRVPNAVSLLCDRAVEPGSGQGPFSRDDSGRNPKKQQRAFSPLPPAPLAGRRREDRPPPPARPTRAAVGPGRGCGAARPPVHPRRLRGRGPAPSGGRPDTHADNAEIAVANPRGRPDGTAAARRQFLLPDEAVGDESQE